MPLKMKIDGEFKSIGGGGGPITTDAITAEGFPDEGGVNGMTLTDFLLNFSEVILTVLEDNAVQTTDAITLVSFPEELNVNGMTLTDFLTGFGGGMRDILDRLDAIESVVELPGDGPIVH